MPTQRAGRFQQIPKSPDDQLSVVQAWSAGNRNGQNLGNLMGEALIGQIGEECDWGRKEHTQAAKANWVKRNERKLQKSLKTFASAIACEQAVARFVNKKRESARVFLGHDPCQTLRGEGNNNSRVTSSKRGRRVASAKHDDDRMLGFEGRAEGGVDENARWVGKREGRGRCSGWGGPDRGWGLNEWSCRVGHDSSGPTHEECRPPRCDRPSTSLAARDREMKAKGGGSGRYHDEVKSLIINLGQENDVCCVA